MKNFRTILTAILLLCCATLSAHDFEVDGIFYKILSEEDRTVKVTYNVSYSGNVVIPANVTYEGTTYSVTTIGVEAFYCCNGLTSITIPNSVTTIGNSAFYSCDGLTSITIPNSVTTIGVEAFSNCGSLTSIVVAEDNTIYDSREDCNAIIETATNTLIRGCKNTVIHNSVTTIGERAFDNCRYLTSIVIPNSVTTIGNCAFQSCTSLTNITIPNSVTTIGGWAFFSCYGLTSVTIGNSVTTIGKSAFYNCKNLTSITIPNSVTTIGDYAFSSCESLTSVTSLIPADKLFSIDSSVFNGVDKNACTLYVPYGAKETYAATKCWNQFTNIVELEDTNIDKVVSPNNSLYFDLNGHGVENPTRGIYIVNGKKVLVK